MVFQIGEDLAEFLIDFPCLDQKQPKEAGKAFVSFRSMPLRNKSCLCRVESGVICARDCIVVMQVCQ